MFLQTPSFKGYIDFRVTNFLWEQQHRRIQCFFKVPKMCIPLHTCKFLVLSQADPQHITNYLFLLFLILKLCYRSLYCDLDNRSLLIRYCQNHKHITWYKVMEKHKWLAMPDTNLVILHHAMLRTNSSFFSIPLFFSWNKNIISFLQSSSASEWFSVFRLLSVSVDDSISFISPSSDLFKSVFFYSLIVVFRFDWGSGVSGFSRVLYFFSRS